MRTTFSCGLVWTLALFVPQPILAQNKRPMAVDDLFRFQRVADPQISPDGRQVVYTVTTVDLARNRTRTNLWLAPALEGAPRPLTTADKHDRHPRWSPDGKQILFESDRSGDSQLWLIDVNGGEARHLTSIATEASNGIWSHDGKWLAFVSAVYPEYSSKSFAESNDLNKKRIEEAAKNPVKARVFTKLFFRHWDQWVEDKRQHLFVMPAAGGEPKDVTPGDRDGYPTSDTFSIGDDFTFSPDNHYLVYTAPPAKDEAWSTNYDIQRVPITGGTSECLTAENRAADGAPGFSPDGKHMAYRAQKRAGFEADRWQLMVVDTDASGAFKGKPRSITENFDAWVGEFVWSGNDRVRFTAEVQTETPIFSFSISKPETNLRYQNRSYSLSGQTTGWVASEGGTHASLSIDREGKTSAYTVASLQGPAEVYVHRTLEPEDQTGRGVNNSAFNRSQANAKLYAELDLPRPETIDVPGAGGTAMQMWILKPPGFDPQKKWPMVYLVHGGPQGAWENGWSFRWNAEIWAAQGYIVALPNPRGSTGFGQKYVDEISGDWGGKCYLDLMAGLAHMEKQPYIDRERLAAAGASFGGYMMNWFQGHTTNFKTLITHCGVYNFDSMYATTEELWFDEWEHGGPPWGKNRHSYENHSPHRFAKDFKTPMLIIHNDRDFRVPVSEGLQLFTTLQRRGIPSRMINFPDEGHWVLKPANSAYWHKEVFDWLKKYVRPGGR
jgi:dipeptidyl aminopeptidase/acylaminoacyl peptidase